MHCFRSKQPGTRPSPQVLLTLTERTRLSPGRPGGDLTRFRYQEQDPAEDWIILLYGGKQDASAPDSVLLTRSQLLNAAVAFHGHSA